VDLDPWKVVAGAIVGFTVGLTGMGGGALMTPILVIVFGINPGTAVSSDLLASLVMKPIGATVHRRQGTISWRMAGWLTVGSVPSAFAGVFVLRQLGTGSHVADWIKTLLGWALIVAAVSMVAKAVLVARERRRLSGGRVGDPEPDIAALEIKRIATIAVGLAGGFIVGMTSVGSGSLMMVMLLLLYPALTAKQLVGTDLVQAIPLVGSATVSHLLFGHVDFGLTGALLVGSVPGVYLGARVSSRAPDAVIRPVLVVVLFASALKLLNFSNGALALAVLLLVAVGAPLWGATDASLRPAAEWEASGLNRTTWVTAQATTAPFLIGFPVAIAYWVVARRRLRDAAVTADLRASP
jgi:uncharacterized membrane protein YfcA